MFKVKALKTVAIIVSSIALFVTLGLSDKASTLDAIRAEGFTHIELTGYSVFACKKGEFNHDTFSATFDGASVTGVVCSRYGGSDPRIVLTDPVF